MAYHPDIPDTDRVTPPEMFFNRRRFIQAASFAAAAAPFACAESAEPEPMQARGNSQDDVTAQEREKILSPPITREEVNDAARNEAFELPGSIERHELTPRLSAATHNNFYEFLPGRGGPVWKHAGDFTVDPWTVEVTGECDNPMTLSLDDLFRFEQEERLYHFRCVERWAMNVPWTGFPLRQLIEKAKPNDNAKFLRFFSARRAEQMPGIEDAPWYPWPYFEGLRMDEAMHDLAFAATGIYGEPLLKQHGAPIRLAIPWKYGYKGPKSIVRIEFVAEQPQTFWRQLQPQEYGFLSNVNPNIPHPRWSQARSYWLDTGEWFDTPIFNGYDKYVADLYPDEPRSLQDPLKPGEVAR